MGVWGVWDSNGHQELSEIEWETWENEQDEVSKLLNWKAGQNIQQKATEARLKHEIAGLKGCLEKMYNKKARAAALRDERRRAALAAEAKAKATKQRVQAKLCQRKYRNRLVALLGGGAVGKAKLAIIRADEKRAERAKAPAR